MASISVISQYHCSLIPAKFKPISYPPSSPLSVSLHGASSLTSSFLKTSITTNPFLPYSKFPKPSKKNSKFAVMSMEAGIGVMGTKLGMMSFFEPNGTVVPVTVVGFKEGNIVTQIKTEATDGYDAVQVGYERVRDKKLNKPELGHLQKIGTIPMRHLQEFRLQTIDGFEPNQRLNFSEMFKEGDIVDVSGTTIGKGFQGILLDLFHFLLLLIIVALLVGMLKTVY